MTLRKVFPIILSLLIFSPPAYAFTGYVQRFDEDRTIAWGDGDVTVAREVELSAHDEAEPASPMAVRKAASLARKQMLDMILSVRIDARQTVSAFLSDNDDLAVQLRGLVHNSLFEGPDLLRGVRTVTVSESLRGRLAELILPTTVQFQSGIPPRLSTATGPAFVPEPVGGAGGYTGVIVVAYSNVADPAQLASRVGKRPLVVKAARTYGSWRTDLIISTPEAALVRAIMQSGKAVKGGVVIAVDPPSPSEKSAVEEGDSDA